VKSVDQHLADVLEGVEPLQPLELQLLDADGCVLAEDVAAPWDLPMFDNSAMDGYAVRVADVEGAHEGAPAVLPVVGDVPAGTPPQFTVQPGMSARVMTGAEVPLGTEAVVPLEWTDGGITGVSITQQPEPGAHIRRRGEDVQAGQVVLEAGHRLGPAQLGMLAAVGRARALVRPKPRVVILSTGSELVEPGTTPGPGQISESNSYMLSAAAHQAGALAYRIGIVPDDPRTLLDTIEDQLIRADLVVTTGGVSVGAYDVVKEVLTRLGTVEFSTVAMQPGKPQGHGHIGPDGTPIFTLPGNPVSAYVSFEVFVRPVIRRMLGAEPLHRPMVRAICLEGLDSPVGKRQYVRGRLEVRDGRYVATPVGGQGSHLMGGLAQSNALLVVPDDVGRVNEGEPVAVMVLERRLV
jgi:molybdopterin molybdotransferase